MSSTSGSGSAAEQPARAATARTKALENCSWAWLMLSPRPSDGGALSDIVFRSVVLVGRLGRNGRRGGSLAGGKSGFNLWSDQSIEHVLRVPDRLIQLRHTVLELAVIECPPLDRGQRRERRRGASDVVVGRQDRRPAPPASRFRPVGRPHRFAPAVPWL